MSYVFPIKEVHRDVGDGKQEKQGNSHSLSPSRASASNHIHSVPMAEAEGFVVLLGRGMRFALPCP